MLRLHCFFFFKQKTAYEITHSDWSSDVCSSDLSTSRAAATAVARWPFSCPVRLRTNLAQSVARLPDPPGDARQRGSAILLSSRTVDEVVAQSVSPGACAHS